MTAGGVALFIVACLIAAAMLWALAQEIPRT